MLHDILERHRDELAFLWPQRAAAVHAPSFDLRTLGDLDERIEAHLDGLRIAGDAGLTLLSAALDPAEPGVVFAAAALALEVGAPRLALEPALELASDEVARRALVSAFGWASFEHARPVADALLSASTPAHRALGLAAYAAHRRDPGGALSNALLDVDPLVRARALRAAGELGRRDLVADLSPALADADEACRFWAAWSLALLGEPTSPVLWSFITSPRFGERAAAMAARRTDPRQALAELESASARAEMARAALVGAGALGDPAAVPWIVARMEDEALARFAGDAFTMITGLAIEGDLVAARPPEDPEAAPAGLHPDHHRAWPAPAAVAAAFRARGGELRRGTRYLLGQPITEGAARRVLRLGRQPQRAAAAVEQSLLSPGKPLFEVRAPAPRQG